MADRIKGITIEIGGDATKLSSALSGVNKDLKDTQSALKDVDKLLKLDPKNVTLLSQKQELLKKAIEDTKAKLDTEKTALEQLKNADKTPEVAKQQQALEREIADTEQQLKSLNSEFSTFGTEGVTQTKTVKEKLDGLSKSAKDVAGKLGDAAKKFAPISAAAAAAGGAMLKMGYDAASNADELNTLAKQTGFSTAEIQKMQYASELVDVSFEDITGALRKMKGNMDGQPELWKKLGVETKNADGSMRDATDVFYDTIDALSDIENETERDQAAMDIFGKSADDLAGIIDDGGQAMKDYGKEAEDMGLILTQDTIDSLNETNDTIDKLKGQMSGTLAQIGADIATILSPALETAAEFIGGITEKLRALTPEQQGAILAIVGIVAAIGPLMGALSGLVSGISFLMSPMGLIVLAIVEVIAIGVELYQNWDTICQWATTLKENVVKNWEELKKNVVEKVENIKKNVSEKWNNMKKAVSDAAENIRKTASEKWEAAKKAVSDAAENIRSTASQKWEAVKTATSTAFEAVKGFISDPIGTAEGIVVNMAKTVEEKLGFTGLTEKVQGIFDTVKKFIDDPIGTAKELVSTAAETIKSKLSFDGLKSTVESIFNGIKTFIETPINAAESVITSVTKTIEDKLGFTGLTSTVESIFNSVKELITSPIDSAKSTVSGILEDIKGLFSGLHLSIPKFNMELPHFTLTTAQKTILGKTITIPVGFSVEWYAKAMKEGMLLDGATIFGAMGGNLLGGGETGKEVIIGQESLVETFRAAVADRDHTIMRQNATIIQLLQRQNALTADKSHVYLNSRELTRSLRDLGVSVNG